MDYFLYKSYYKTHYQRTLSKKLVNRSALRGSVDKSYFWATDNASMKPFVANTVHIFDVRDGADTRFGDLTKKVSVKAKDGFKNPASYDGNAAYDQMAKVTENKDKIIPGKENENPPKGYIAISVVNDKTSVKTEVKRIYWVKNDESVRYNDIVLRANAD